jgi:hypothetical protein
MKRGVISNEGYRNREEGEINGKKMTVLTGGAGMSAGKREI